VPYSSAYNNGRVKTDSSYKLRFIKEGKKKFATLSVDENQVINGDVLNIADKAEIQFEELSENQ
jgi:hypothetical protein